MESTRQAITKFQPQPNKPIRVQIAEHLRHMIGSGQLKVGAKLPTTQQLAETWQTQAATVHKAMTMLVKEGLLDRSRNFGTFVAEKSRKLTRAGIYLRRDIFCEPAAAFARTLVSQLGKQLAEEGVETEIFADTRARGDRGNPWAELVRAAEQRRIQALLMPDAIDLERPWVSRLAIPWVEYAPNAVRNRVNTVQGDQERMAVGELSRCGCRSIGLITPEVATGRGLQGFVKLADELGMQTREAWLEHALEGQEAGIPEAESERFGYEAMHRILEMPDRPDGLYVKHDWVARGALTAVLESKVVVPDELKLVFYRNEEVDWICPVAASFVEGSITEVAELMIEMMHGQLRGEEVEPKMRTFRVVPAPGYEAPEDRREVAVEAVGK